VATLEDDFHKAMVAIYEQEKDCGYYATYFKQMLDQYGGLEAAKRLLAGEEVQQGLMKLWELGHLNNSVEAHVLQYRFRALFSNSEVK
jgi:hypothetical protein